MSFGWEVRDGVGFVTLIGAERKNPLTFESYAALRDHFRDARVLDRRCTSWSSPASRATSAPVATCTTSSAR